jgi:hypothetical protein
MPRRLSVTGTRTPLPPTWWSWRWASSSWASACCKTCVKVRVADPPPKKKAPYTHTIWKGGHTATHICYICSHFDGNVGRYMHIYVSLISTAVSMAMEICTRKIAYASYRLSACAASICHTLQYIIYKYSCTSPSFSTLYWRYAFLCVNVLPFLHVLSTLCFSLSLCACCADPMLSLRCCRWGSKTTANVSMMLTTFTVWYSFIWIYICMYMIDMDSHTHTTHIHTHMQWLIIWIHTNIHIHTYIHI